MKANIKPFTKEVEDCAQENNNRKVTLRDKNGRCSFCVENPNNQNIIIISVDQCIVSLTDKQKCDFCVEIPDVGAHYVELKGKQLDKAISQLKATLGHFKQHHSKLQKSCYAVVTAVPKMRTGVQDSKLKFRKDTKTPLYVSTMKHTLAI